MKVSHHLANVFGGVAVGGAAVAMGAMVSAASSVCFFTAFLTYAAGSLGFFVVANCRSDDATFVPVKPVSLLAGAFLGAAAALFTPNSEKLCKWAFNTIGEPVTAQYRDPRPDAYVGGPR
jgi:hypothetical protein